MLDEVHRHQDEGRATFIVSAAGNDLVSSLARVLGMEGGIGTRWEVGEDDAYTGRMDGPFVYGEGKVEAMRRFAIEHGIDMKDSYAYSDSESDLPMLRCVGHPVVVNPDQALLEVARAEGWRVMRFERLRLQPPLDPPPPQGQALARDAPPLTRGCVAGEAETQPVTWSPGPRLRRMAI